MFKSRSTRPVLAVALFCLLGPALFCAAPLAAQALTDKDLEEAGGVTASGTTNDSGPLGVIPVQKGFNASLGTSSQHDSSSGWSSEFSPDMAYRFNRHFSVDASVPLYAYINTYENTGTKLKPVYNYVARNGAFGDTALSLHYDADPFHLGYDGTATMGLPSGNTVYGLGAGQVTYNFNNHVERTFGFFTPDLEIGYGDSSSLVDQRVKKSYVAVGPLAHFQAGFSLDLPHGIDFEADLYEELPLAQDLVYSTTGKGKKKVTTATNVGPAEDNGFLNTLDVPVTPHITLSGFYNRSLRDHDDTAGFSLTFLLRAPPRLPSAF